MSDLQREQAAKCLDVREPVIDVEGFSQCLRRLNCVIGQHLAQMAFRDSG